MKNTLTAASTKRQAAFIAFGLAMLFLVLGGILFGVSFSTRYTENFEEMTFTVTQLEKSSDDEGTTLIHTKETAVPLRISNIFDDELPFEVIKENLEEGTVITVHASVSDIENNRGDIYISSLAAQGKTLLSYERGIELQLNNLRISRIIGIIVASISLITAVAALIIALKTPKEKDYDLFTFINKFAVGPMNKLRMKIVFFGYCVPVFLCLILGKVLLFIFDERGNETALAATAIIMTSIFVIFTALLIILTFTLIKNKEINYYGDLFSFSPEVLPEAPEGDAADVYFDCANYMSVSFNERGLHRLSFEEEEAFFEETQDFLQNETLSSDVFAEYKETPYYEDNQPYTSFFPYEELNFRAVAFYNNKPTRMTILIASELSDEFASNQISTDDYPPLTNDICFILDGALYMTLQKYNVHVRGLETALKNRYTLMRSAKKENGKANYFTD